MYIRNATLADAKGIAKVHVDSWRTTYKNIISDEFLQKLSYGHMKKQIFNGRDFFVLQLGQMLKNILSILIIFIKYPD